MFDPFEREPYPYSGWDDLKFSLAGLAAIAAPFALLAWFLLVVL